MTDESPTIVMTEPVSKTTMINKLVAEEASTNQAALPMGFSDGEDEGLPTIPVSDKEISNSKDKTVSTTVAESKSAKAAKESKELRQAKAKQAELENKLNQALTKAAAAENFDKVKQLISTNPKEALKILGVEQFKLYQNLTDQFLNGDPDMKAKDPVEEKLKQLDPYVEAFKKKEQEEKLQAQIKKDQEEIKAVITRDIYPLVSKQEEFECLYDYFASQDSNLTADQVKDAVANSIYNNANEYFVKNLKENYQQLLKEFGNYSTYLSTIATHLEKQLEEQIEKAAQKAAKLNKFKNKVSPKQSVQAETKVSEETNSTSLPTLADVVNSSSKTNGDSWISKDPNKKSAIEALLKANNLL